MNAYIEVRPVQASERHRLLTTCGSACRILTREHVQSTHADTWHTTTVQLSDVTVYPNIPEFNNAINLLAYQLNRRERKPRTEGNTYRRCAHLRALGPGAWGKQQGATVSRASQLFDLTCKPLKLSGMELRNLLKL